MQEENFEDTNNAQYMGGVPFFFRFHKIVYVSNIISILICFCMSATLTGASDILQCV